MYNHSIDSILCDVSSHEATQRGNKSFRLPSAMVASIMLLKIAHSF